MDRHSTPRTVSTGPWLAIVLALAAVVGVVALTCILLVRSGPGSPQDNLARIPVSTATPYPYATTSTPWRTETTTATDRGLTTTATRVATTNEPGSAPRTTLRAATGAVPRSTSARLGAPQASSP